MLRASEHRLRGIVRLIHTLAWSVAFSVTVVGCTFPEFDFDPIPEDDDQTGSTTTAGSGGTGAADATVSSSVSSSGGGGSPAQPCVLTSVGTCGIDMKCSIVNASTGETGCVDAGARPAFAVCLEDSECEEGTFCDGFTSVCKPFCTSATTCGLGLCIDATSEAGPIPGASVCTANCDPQTVEPCALGGVTCYYDGPIHQFDCIASVGKSEGEACEFINDCDGGLLCFKNVCDPWCAPINESCGPGLFGGFCYSVAISYETTQLGVCVSP